MSPIAGALLWLLVVLLYRLNQYVACEQTPPQGLLAKFKDGMPSVQDNRLDAEQSLRESLGLSLSGFAYNEHCLSFPVALLVLMPLSASHIGGCPGVQRAPSR